MESSADIVAIWVAQEILPHEGRIRAWLSARWRGAVDADDVIQEAYCRLAALASVDHIENPLAYFRRAVHAAAVDAMRRAHGNILVPMTETGWSGVMDEEPLADRKAEAAQELLRVKQILAGLSETSRRVIELRRIEGLSQRETAERLGVSENVVENSIVRGLRKLLSALADQDAGAQAETEEQEEVRIGKPRSR